MKNNRFLLVLLFVFLILVCIYVFVFFNMFYSLKKAINEYNDNKYFEDVACINHSCVDEPEKDQTNIFLEKTEEPEKTVLGEFRLTAYCSCEKCCGKWAINRPVDEQGEEIVVGSTGERLCQGVSVAVDPSVIPYGSKIEINGHEYKAQDCGYGIDGNEIDIYFDNHADALDFGVQYSEVVLIEEEK